MPRNPEIGSAVPPRAVEVEPPVPLTAGGSAESAWPVLLTSPLREVLGLMCFQLGAIAHVYQAAGEFSGAGGERLQKRAEDEQAFMLHKLIGFVFAAGDNWRTLAQADLNRAKAVVAELEGAA